MSVIADQMNQIERDQQDAERYRYLRSAAIHGIAITSAHFEMRTNVPEDLDGWVDEMREENP